MTTADQNVINLLNVKIDLNVRTMANMYNLHATDENLSQMKVLEKKVRDLKKAVDIYKETGNLPSHLLLGD